MRNTRLNICLFASLALGLSALLADSAFAQSAQSKPKAAAKSAAGTASDQVAIKLVRQRIAMVDGKEVKESADFIKPGEVLEETATYANTSKEAVKNLDATLPVPDYTELVAGSMKPAAAKASIDGKTYADIPLKRKVKDSKGVTTEQMVPISDYHFLRWNAALLNGGEALSFSARFKVSDNGVTAPPVPGKNANKK